jgi:hypothetical protein
LKEFLKKKCNRTDIPFRDLDVPFLAEFDFYAKTVWKCCNNAALKHIQRIRKVVGLAVISGFLEKDPFLGFKGEKREIEQNIPNGQAIGSIGAKEF